MMKSKLAPGSKAPDFTSVDHTGKPINLSGFKGRRLVLYFYPKDNTSGCTAEACNLRDGYEVLQGLGFAVIGVSPDSESSHRHFAGKYSLPFSLIADADHSVAEAYGVWGVKNMYGRAYMGVRRTTYLIDQEGIVTHVFDKVDTKDHVNQILQAVKMHKL